MLNPFCQKLQEVVKRKQRDEANQEEEHRASVVNKIGVLVAEVVEPGWDNSELNLVEVKDLVVDHIGLDNLEVGNFCQEEHEHLGEAREGDGAERHVDDDLERVDHAPQHLKRSGEQGVHQKD